MEYEYWKPGGLTDREKHVRQITKVADPRLKEAMGGQPSNVSQE